MLKFIFKNFLPLAVLELVTDRNKILWPKPNRNRISATIPVSAETEAETETLKKLKLMILSVLESMCTFQLIKELCYKCLKCFFFLLVCKQ